MNQGFDQELMRSYDDQLKLFNKKEFHLDYIYQAGDIVGFVTWWEFNSFIFVEHFAIEESCRGSGLGKATIQRFLKKDKLLILEVEIGDNEIDRRRIGFYEASGLFQNEYDYAQPPLQKECPWVPLMVMSSRPLAEDEFEMVKNQLYKKVYNIT